MPQYCAVIFDHDGTLVDSEPVHMQMWQQLLKPHTLSQETYETQLSGIPSIESSRWLIKHFKLTDSPEGFLNKKLALLHDYLKQQACPLLKGVPEIIKHLQKHRVALGIASGAMANEVERSLNFHNLHSAFSAVATGDQVDNNKPAPDVYLRAAKQLGLTPNTCVAIEDSDSGHQSALSAGMFCLRLRTKSVLPPQKNTLYIKDMAEAQIRLNALLALDV